MILYVYLFPSQEFCKEFTTGNLFGFLLAELNVVVNCWLCSSIKYAKLKLSSQGRAVISSGWPRIVQDFKLEEGSICCFTFKDERDSEKRDPVAWLRLVITPLED